MIKVHDLTPSVYYNQSRDFQFLGRLFEIVLNSVKTNAELINNVILCDNSDEQLIDLMTMTLGFSSKHKYNVVQLTALCSAFCEIIRNKGNINSIQLAVDALLASEGINKKSKIVVNDNTHTINVMIPNELSDINLFNDLLDYVLPAGMSCEIERATLIEQPTQSTFIGQLDNVLYYAVDENTHSGETMLIANSYDSNNEVALTNKNNDQLTPMINVLGNNPIARPISEKKGNEGD